MSTSVRGGEVEGRTGDSLDVRPARRHYLRPGVERDTLWPVDVLVAEQGVLPPAERVVGHRHRDGHVDPDHPDVHLALEPARRLTRGGEDGGAVAVRVRVDQRDGL